MARHVRQFCYLAALLMFSTHDTLASDPSAVLPLKSVAYGISFNVDISLGGQSYPVIVDTGSADLWVMGSDWTCYYGGETTEGTQVPRSECFTGNKTYTESSTFTPISNAWIGEHYGAGNVIGTLGFEDAQLGAITIPQQEMGVINASTMYNDGYCSGLMGLGYPDIAQIHPSDYSATNSLELLEHRLLYPTVLTRMAGLGVEYFSMALERTPLNQESGFGKSTTSDKLPMLTWPAGGYLGFAALPSVAHGPFVTAPVEITKTIPTSFTNDTRKITFWTTTVEAAFWADATYEEPFQVVVDSGNWQNILPEAAANKINAAFDPPAVPHLSASLGNETYYKVDCDATPPAGFGIQIAGKTFQIDPADMIWRDDSGTCYSSISPGIPEQRISLMFLGDAFLKNVVAVFDYGKDEMRFAQRISNASYTGQAVTGAASTSASPRLGLAPVMIAGVLALL